MTYRAWSVFCIHYIFVFVSRAPPMPPKNPGKTRRYLYANFWSLFSSPVWPCPLVCRFFGGAGVPCGVCKMKIIINQMHVCGDANFRTFSPIIGTIMFLSFSYDIYACSLFRRIQLSSTLLTSVKVIGTSHRNGMCRSWMISFNSEFSRPPSKRIRVGTLWERIQIN